MCIYSQMTTWEQANLIRHIVCCQEGSAFVAPQIAQIMQLSEIDKPQQWNYKRLPCSLWIADILM